MLVGLSARGMKYRFRKARLRPEPNVRMTMSLPRLYVRSHQGIFEHLLDCESYVKAMAAVPRDFGTYFGIDFGSAPAIVSRVIRSTGKARQCGARFEIDPVIAADSARIDSIQRDFYRRFGRSSGRSRAMLRNRRRRRCPPGRWSGREGQATVGPTIRQGQPILPPNPDHWPPPPSHPQPILAQKHPLPAIFAICRQDRSWRVSPICPRLAIPSPSIASHIAS